MLRGRGDTADRGRRMRGHLVEDAMGDAMLDLTTSEEPTMSGVANPKRIRL